MSPRVMLRVLGPLARSGSESIIARVNGNDRLPCANVFLPCASPPIFSVQPPSVAIRAPKEKRKSYLARCSPTVLPDAPGPRQCGN
mmetsp:Transcript_31266/g.70671  ORF Transcript_31266/g.70671 Transcript_31266/m.70671 type:complete len:86 (+) Transcript_31266:951-1208(+)